MFETVAYPEYPFIAARLYFCVYEYLVREIMADQIRNIVTGYGARYKVFDGDAQKYELWEVKLMSYFRLRKVLDVREYEDVSDVNMKCWSFCWAKFLPSWYSSSMIEAYL